ncbi:MAG: hypothetical protein ABIG32_01750 [Candidatus Uhrbacteria bacterium]|nr:hypothetical protein [Patescibacteria group bacterium]MBU1907291.1 hypothetical protein [Patescibacteria group bacterium]
MNFMGKDGHLLGTDENLFISEEIVDPTAQVPAPPVVQLQTREPQSVVPPPAPRQVQSSVWNIPIMQPLPPDPSSAMWETVTAVQNSKPKAPQAPRPINWPLAAARIGIFIALPLLIIGALILLLIKLL